MCVLVGVPRAEGSVAKHVTQEVGLVSRMTGDKQVSMFIISTITLRVNRHMVGMIINTSNE